MRTTARDGLVRAQPWRLTDIAVVVDADGFPRTDAWYRLEYLDEAGQLCAGEIEPTGWLGDDSLLKRVVRVDPTDSTRTRELRCNEYSDERADIDDEGVVLLEGGAGALAWNAPFIPMVINFDGDAWPDLWMVGSTAWENDGGTLVVDTDFYDSLPDFPHSAAGTAVDPAWMVLDVDRDGATELIYLLEGCSVGGELCGDLYRMGAGSRALVGEADAVLLDEVVLRNSTPADIDGDGYVDLVVKPHDYLSGSGYGSDQHQWIRNKGESPWFDMADIADLVLPLDPGSGAVLRDDLEDAQATCEGLDGTAGYDHDWYEAMPPGQLVVYDGYKTKGGDSGLGVWDDADHYASTQVRMGDYNGDGITDLAYALYPCWWWDGTETVPTALGPELDGVEPISRLYYGDGQGGFIDTGLSAGAPWHQATPDTAFLSFDDGLSTSELYEETWGDMPDYHWSATEYWAAVDLDRSGAVDFLHLGPETYYTDSGWYSAEHLGLGSSCLPEWATGGGWFHPASSTCDADSAALQYMPDTAMRQSPLPVASTLPADWDGDGFVDLLRIRKGEDPAGASTADGYDFQALLLKNQLTTARGRLTRIHTAYGGTIELTWGMSLDSADNDDVPFVQEVIASVRDEDGLTTYDFQGAKFEQGRARGFRDAVATYHSGAVETWRFGQSPPVAGQTVLHGVRDPDGYLVQLDVNIPLAMDVSSSILDAEAPYFNPVQRSCSFKLQRGEGPDEQDLLEDCLGYLGPAAPAVTDLAVALGWEGRLLTTWALWDAVWAVAEDPALVVGDSGVEVLATVPWTPTLAAPAGTTFAATDGALPSEIAVPSNPTWSLPAHANPGWKMSVTDTQYGDLQRVEQVDAWRDTAISDDDLVTRLGWDTWDLTAAGTRLRSQQIESDTGLILSRTEYSEFGDYDLAERVIQYGEGLSDSRAWQREFTQGELTRRVDPDTNVTTWQRNSCGQYTRRRDAASRIEIRNYDDACRLTGRNWQGGQVNTVRDGFGRIASRGFISGGLGPPGVPRVEYYSYDDDIDTVDVRGTWDEPRWGVRYGVSEDDPVRMVYLDPWGRESLDLRCPGAGGDTSASGDVLTELGCQATGAVYQATAYAEDGSLRMVSSPYAEGDVAPVSWMWSDGLGRRAVRYDPAPIEWPLNTSEAQWVETSWQYDLDQVAVTDPEEVTCTRGVDGLSGFVECGGVTVAVVDVDALGRLEHQEDGDGRAVELQRDAFGRVAHTVQLGSATVYEDGVVSTVTNPTWSSVWSPGGRLLSQEDPDGNEVVWTRDNLGRPLTATRIGAGGGSLLASAWTYDDSDTPSEMPSSTFFDVNGNSWTTYLDGFGRTSRRMHPDGSWEAWDYDDQGRLAQSRDVDGREHTMVYDDLGYLLAREVLVVEPGAPDRVVSEEYDYSADGTLVWTEDADGVETKFDTAWNGLPLRARRPSPAGTTWTLGEWEYDNRGAVLFESEAGVHHSYDYDDQGRLVRACLGTPTLGDDLSCTSERTLTWTDAGLLETSTLDGSLTTTWTYDDLGMQRTAVHPGPAQERWDYDRVGRLTRYQDEASVTSTWVHDGLGRLIEEHLPGMAAPRIINYTYGVNPLEVDASGDGVELHQIIEPDGGAWFTFYDFAGRRVWMDRPDASAEQQLYAGSMLTDVVHHDTLLGVGFTEIAREERTYDGLGRLREVLGPYDPDGPAYHPDVVDRYTWTDAGRLTSVEDALGQQTRYTWEAGFLAGEEVDGLIVRDLIYDPGFPRVTTATTVGADGGGVPLASSAERTSDYDYDALGRLTDAETTLVDGGLTDTIASRYSDFDAYGTPRQVDAEDNGVIVVDETRVTDERGRLEESWLSVEGSHYGVATYGHRPNGQVSELDNYWADTTHRSVSYARDSDGLVTSVTDATAGSLASVGGRDAMGRITQLTLGGGTEVDLTWDPLGQAMSLDLVLPSGAMHTRGYTYDARGRLETRTVQGIETSYGYAEPGWLTDELEHDLAGDVVSQHIYQYDDAGNRTSHKEENGAGVSVATHSFTYGPGNRLDSVDGNALTWDDLGGVVTDHRGYTIDRFPDGRAATVGTPGDPTGMLDVLGDPVTLPGTSIAVDVVRDAEGMPVRIYDGSPNPHTRVWGNPMGPWPLAGDSEGAHWMWIGLEGMMISRLEGATVAVDAMTDPVGGSLALLGDDLLDAPGAWGTDLDTPAGRTARFVYAGQEVLPQTPYMMAGHRVYDPEAGRFMSADPLGLDGGPHRYVYANNQPTGLVDPRGLSAVGMGLASSGVWQPPVIDGDGNPVPSAGGRRQAGPGCGPGCWNTADDDSDGGGSEENGEGGEENPSDTENGDDNDGPLKEDEGKFESECGESLDCGYALPLDGSDTDSDTESDDEVSSGVDPDEDDDEDEDDGGWGLGGGGSVSGPRSAPNDEPSMREASESELFLTGFAEEAGLNVLKGLADPLEPLSPDLSTHAFENVDWFVQRRKYELPEAYRFGTYAGDALSLAAGAYNLYSSTATLSAGGGLVLAGVGTKSPQVVLAGTTALTAAELQALAAAGLTLRSLDQILSAMASDGGRSGKVGKQRDGTPGNNQAQNRQFRDATRGLTKDEKRRLHQEISGENLSFQETRELADEIKANRGSP